MPENKFTPANPYQNLLALKRLAAMAAKMIRAERGNICVVSHFDADGICAAGIFYHAFKVLGKEFEVNFVRDLGGAAAEDVSEKHAALWIFADIGSGQLDALESFFAGKKIIVCDHHPPESVSWSGLTHVNPFLLGIDGTKDISGAGVAYLVASELTAQAKSTVELAVAGAFADMQSSRSKLHGINGILLEEAELSGRVKTEIGLEVFGRYTRPVHKALANSTEPYIKGITGDESRAVQLLSSLGIPLKEKNRWRTISDLSRDEEKKLATALIIEQVFSGDDAREIIGKNFRLKSGFELRELASALNACGRLMEPLEGMKLALGLPNGAEGIVAHYRKKVAQAVAWIGENMDDFQKTKSALYIVAGSNIAASMMGTAVSIISKNNSFPAIFGFADSDGEVKVSARADRDSGADLDKVTRAAAEACGGTGGGHRTAAGAKIPAGSEKKFIEECEALFKLN